jgi:hypothetical protein
MTKSMRIPFRHLTSRNAKLDKGLESGWYTVGLSLSPSTESVGVGGMNMCPNSGVCAAVCLNHTGQNKLNQSRNARIRRTLAYKEAQRGIELASENYVEGTFDNKSRMPIDLRWAATMHGFKLALRPNILSDQRRLGVALARLHPHLPVYDYTKNTSLQFPSNQENMPENYNLTFSLDEKNASSAVSILKQGQANVAVVFDLGKNDPLPKEWNLKTSDGGGYPKETGVRPVVDGDENDLRFLDPKGVFVGLRFKGSKADRAIAKRLGFIYDPCTEGGVQ